MSAMVWNGLLTMVRDARLLIAQLDSQARQHFTRRDAVSVLLVLIGFADLWRWSLTDTVLIQLGEWLGIGVILRSYSLVWRVVLSTHAAERWKRGQQVLTAVARVQLLRLGLGLVGPALLELFHEMPMESTTMVVAFLVVWLVVCPTRGCRCHAD